MKSTICSQLEFEKIEAVRQIITCSFARCFMKVDLGQDAGVFGVAWRSEFVHPSIVEGNDGSIWIGADNYVAAIDKASGHVRSLLCLPTNFQRLYEYPDATIVLYETGFIAFNKDKSIRRIAGFGDVIVGFERQGNVLLVTTSDQQKRTIEF